MHLSMHNWMRAEPIEVTIRRLAKYGYESIEIGGEPDKYDTADVRLMKQAGRIPSNISKTASPWLKNWMGKL